MWLISPKTIVLPSFLQDQLPNYCMLQNILQKYSGTGRGNGAGGQSETSFVDFRSYSSAFPLNMGMRRIWNEPVNQKHHLLTSGITYKYFGRLLFSVGWDAIL
jgi:hypothetical protein